MEVKTEEKMAALLKPRHVNVEVKTEMSGGKWDVALTQNEIDALAAGVSPLHIRPDHLQEYVPTMGLHSSGVVWDVQKHAWRIVPLERVVKNGCTEVVHMKETVQNEET